jgi:predicted acylesterase/phospholipase RssA
VRVLCLGGGGLRAAFQVPIVEALVAAERYDLILGISAGAINGALVAQGDLGELRAGWEASTSPRPLRGVAGIFAISWQPWLGLYSLAPLRSRLRDTVSLARLQVPFACGVVVRETHEYRLLAASDMADDVQLHTALVASGSVAGLMPPVAYRDKHGTWSLYDGGHRHSVPPIPPEYAADVTHVDAVLLTPLRHDPVCGSRNLPHALVWAFENAAELAKRLDLDYLMSLGENDVSVRVYAPARALGGIFDAHPDIVRLRFEQGEAALDHPLEL